MCDGKDTLLIFMPCLEYGGAEKQFRLLRNGLVAKNVHVITILTDSDVADLDTIVSKNRIYSIGAKGNFLSKEWEIYKIVKRILKNHKVQFAIVYDKYAQFAIPILKKFGIKTLFSERNSGEHEHWISRKMICMADLITANSFNAVMEMHRYVNKDVYYIPNGVEIEETHNEPMVHFEKSGRIKIVVPARIAPVKNQMLVVKALKDMTDIEVHFVGKISDDAYHKEIKACIERYQQNEKFIYDGFVTNMKSYYKNYDVVLLPSISEGTSNVILEAFANQIPCIASDIEMNNRVVPRKELLFKSDCAESLFNTLSSIISMEQTDLKIILNDCFNFVKNNYSIDRMVDSYWELIKNGIFK